MTPDWSLMVERDGQGYPRLVLMRGHQLVCRHYIPLEWGDEAGRYIASLVLALAWRERAERRLGGGEQETRCPDSAQ